MNRRDASLALLALAAAPFSPLAFSQGKVWRVGILSPRSQGAFATDPFAGFLRGMRELGYVDGKNVNYELRFADGRYDRLPQLAAELVQRKVDVIVTGGTPATRAAQKATGTIPIVMGSASNPVDSGLVASLARPGANITGVSTMATDVGPKQLEMLLAAIPGKNRIAVLVNPGNPSHQSSLKNLQAAVQQAKVQLIVMEAQSVEEIERAFALMKQKNAQGLILAIDSLFIQQQVQIAALAKKAALPAIFASREFAEAGGLMSYGQSLAENYRRAAAYVDRILKGAKPADLPVEQPTAFELFVNISTAKAFGIKVPQTLLMRADKIVE